MTGRMTFSLRGGCHSRRRRKWGKLMPETIALVSYLVYMAVIVLAGAWYFDRDSRRNAAELQAALDAMEAVIKHKKPEGEA